MAQDTLVTERYCLTGTEDGMGANADAGNVIIGSPSGSWGSAHADKPERARQGHHPATNRDYPSLVCQPGTQAPVATIALIHL